MATAKEVQAELLRQVASGKMSVEDAMAKLPNVKAAGGTLTYKVGEKGGVSVYGLQIRPVTLYVEQWERLIGDAPKLVAFLKEHNTELVRKDRK